MYCCRGPPRRTNSSNTAVRSSSTAKLRTHSGEETTNCSEVVRGDDLISSQHSAIRWVDHPESFEQFSVSCSTMVPCHHLCPPRRPRAIIFVLLTPPDGIAPAPRGVPQIAVTFDLDPNGILNVSAVDKASGKKCHVTITNEKGRMSKSDIEKCIADAEKFAEEDARLKKLVEAKNELENFVYNCQRTKEENSAAFSEEETEAIDKAVRETEEYVFFVATTDLLFMHDI